MKFVIYESNSKSSIVKLVPAIQDMNTIEIGSLLVVQMLLISTRTAINKHQSKLSL